jgi:hypothetical protein
LHLFGDSQKTIVQKFSANFDSIWDTNRSKLATLQNTIKTSSTIPLVYTPMALTYQELGDLRALIRANCTAVDSTDYRDNAASHRTCPR